MSDNAQEPTMEEILASIRRIISEDDAPAEAGAEAKHEPAPSVPGSADDDIPLVLEEEDDVLELTNRVDEPEELEIGPIDDLEVVEAAPPPRYEPPAEPMVREEPLVSRPQASMAASAFDALERSVLMPPGGRSLEDVIREMLRPMLKSWLDEHLPSIVEAQVATEVERIARSRR